MYTHHCSPGGAPMASRGVLPSVARGTARAARPAIKRALQQAA